jgi:hypothetical protein
LPEKPRPLLVPGTLSSSVDRGPSVPPTRKSTSGGLGEQEAMYTASIGNLWRLPCEGRTSFMFQELWMMPMPKGPEQARLYVKELRTAIDSKSSIARDMIIVDHFDDETRQMYSVNPCNDEASQMILDPDETPKDLDDIAVVESPSSTGIPEERYQTLGNWRRLI